MNGLARLYWTARALGWENVPRRAWHLAQGRLGLKRWRLPGGELQPAELLAQFTPDYRAADALDHWRRRADRFLARPDQMSQTCDALRRVADDILWDQQVGRFVGGLLQGRMRFFSHVEAEVGWPVRFNRDPLHGVDWPTGRHWTTYGQFNPTLADMKCVWEASRFSVAYTLARDHARNPESPATGLFWQLLADWDRQNAYGLTAQWACGQEATFRLMAWLFAACVMYDERTADPARYQRLSELVWYTGRHIEENLIYARSQKNNHAISEAVGLWTIGLLFPELRRAADWREQGRRVLLEELDRQIYADGSYVQHSLNYHRLMMDDVLWALRLGELHNRPLAQAAEKLQPALDWLLAMIDPASGRVPNYGANDGAWVLPLCCCDYTDFRPVAQAAHYLLYGQRCFPPGPWDEQMLWLGGVKSLEAPLNEYRRTAHFTAPQGGYYTTSGPRSWAFTRVHSYRDRPAQADMLHLDLWYDGVNVLRDGGSYHYYTRPPWQHYFESTAGHNTIEIDGCDQMVRGPRFLWFRWTRSKLLGCRHSADGRVSYIDAEHYGYRRLPGRVVHRRAIVRVLDSYIVIDDVTGVGEHDVVLRWRLCPADWKEVPPSTGERLHRWETEIAGRVIGIAIAASQPIDAQLLCGQESPTPEGWESLYYADKQPVPTIVARCGEKVPVRLVTVIGPVEEKIGIDLTAMDCAGEKPLLVTGIRDAQLAESMDKTSEGRIIVAAETK